MGFTRVKDGKKPCTVCRAILDISCFGKAKDSYTNKSTGEKTVKYYPNSRCKSCAREQTRNWNRKNKEYVFLKTNQWRNNLKRQVYEHYGGSCVCCGESNFLFMTVDHINNDGYKSRVRPQPGASRKLLISTNWYKHIIESGFPDDLQLLCYNCNCGKQRNYGVCPHKEIITPKYGTRLKK